MSHVRTGPVAEHEQMARVAGPDQERGDLSLFRRGKEFHLFCFVNHFGVSINFENLFCDITQSRMSLTGKTLYGGIAFYQTVPLIAQSFNSSNVNATIPRAALQGIVEMLV